MHLYFYWKISIILVIAMKHSQSNKGEAELIISFFFIRCINYAASLLSSFTLVFAWRMR